MASAESVEPDEIWGGSVVGRIDLALELFRTHCATPGNFLDIGCGVGRSTLHLAEGLGVKQTSGVDVSADLVKHATRRGIDAHVVDLDTESIPYDDASFDAVFCGEVIEHVRDTDFLLDEITRVLRPNGVCVLSTPNLASWINRIALLLGWQPFFTTVSGRHILGRPQWTSAGYGEGDIGHLHVFTTRALLELIAAHDLRLLAIKPYSFAQTMTPTERVLGTPFRNSLVRFGERIDQVVSRRASIATGVVIAFGRNRVPTNSQ